VFLPPEALLLIPVAAGPGGRPDTRTAPRPRSAGLGVLRAFLHFLEHLVEVEAGSLLALRLVPEGLQEFSHISLCRHE
jgi:hypothetical protein